MVSHFVQQVEPSTPDKWDYKKIIESSFELLDFQLDEMTQG